MVETKAEKLEEVIINDLRIMKAQT